MRKYAILPVLAVLVAAALIWGWRAQQAKQAAEMQLGIDSSRVLEQQFSKARAIKVATIQGRITAQSSDPGLWGLLQSSQIKAAPFTLDYFVDLSQVDRSDFRWNEASRTLIVQIPDIVLGRPNVDEAGAKAQFSGIYISRGAALRLNKRAATAVMLRARIVAESHENMNKARTAAREAIRDFARLPLEAAGKKGMKIVVKFPFDGSEKLDQWDESTPIEDIVRTHRTL